MMLTMILILPRLFYATRFLPAHIDGQSEVLFYAACSKHFPAFA